MNVLVIGGVRLIEEAALRGKNIHVKFVTCGRPGCSCKFGQRHGPYYYHRSRGENGKYKDVYIKADKIDMEVDHEVVGDSDLMIKVGSLEQIPVIFAKCAKFVIERALAPERSD